MAGSLFLSALLVLFAVAVTAQDVVPRAAAAAVTSIIDPATQATGAPTSSNDSGSSSSAADSAAGAEGADDGSFKMSKGGMIAIIVVVVVVAVGGIVSTVLFFIAKKRQWEVRKSLKRVSRRLTGRSTVDVARNNREHRRTAVRVASPPPGKNRTAGAQENRNRDLEKGEKKPAGRNQKPTMSAFSVETPVVKSWKDRVFGYKE